MAKTGPGVDSARGDPAYLGDFWAILGHALAPLAAGPT